PEFVEGVLEGVGTLGVVEEEVVVVGSFGVVGEEGELVGLEPVDPGGGAVLFRVTVALSSKGERPRGSPRPPFIRVPGGRRSSRISSTGRYGWRGRLPRRRAPGRRLGPRRRSSKLRRNIRNDMRVGSGEKGRKERV